jgi:hypothetical protein
MTQSAHSPSRCPDGGLSDARRAAICWHIASGQAGISPLLVFGRGSFGEVSTKFAAGVVMAKHSSSKSSSEASKVKAVNLAYYRALSARDLRAMDAVWTCGADNILIAPPANPHSNVGWAARGQRVQAAVSWQRGQVGSPPSRVASPSAPSGVTACKIFTLLPCGPKQRDPSGTSVSGVHLFRPANPGSVSAFGW